MAKPALKWAGGKTQILHKIQSYLPAKANFNHYHEPFFGGGAVFFELQPTNGTINDLNPRLINFYRQVKNNHNKLIETNKSLQQKVNSLDDEGTEEFYYKKRSEFNNLREHDLLKNGIKEASLLLFLNRMCYNGLYRENSSGKFNVPIGSRRNPDVVREERIKAVHEALQGTAITQKDFSYVKNVVEEQDIVYFDPPYKPVSDTANFEEYLADGFGGDKQKQLRDLAIELHERGVFVTISNSYPAKETLYADNRVPKEFEIKEITANRTINRNGGDRTGAKEIIVTNVPKDRQRGTLIPYTD